MYLGKYINIYIWSFAILELGSHVNGHPSAESCHTFIVRPSHSEPLYLWLLFCQRTIDDLKRCGMVFLKKKISIQKELSKKQLKHLISGINAQEPWSWFSIPWNSFLLLPTVKRPILACSHSAVEIIWVYSSWAGERLSVSLFQGFICWPRKQKTLHTSFPFLPANSPQNSSILLSFLSNF